MAAENARAGLRELDLLDRRAKGTEALVGTDRRSRVPETMDALLRTPVLTPKALAVPGLGSRRRLRPRCRPKA